MPAPEYDPMALAIIIKNQSDRIKELTAALRAALSLIDEQHKMQQTILNHIIESEKECREISTPLVEKLRSLI